MSRERRSTGFRDALRAYVVGHDRVATTESEMTHAPGPDSDAPGPDSDVVWDGEWTDPSDEPARYGVGIPDRLEFHRGPATWREDDVGVAHRSGENDAP
jgi:hypothetical protein